jgi:hypothetical protein
MPEAGVAIGVDTCAIKDAIDAVEDAEKIYKDVKNIINAIDTGENCYELNHYINFYADYWDQINYFEEGKILGLIHLAGKSCSDVGNAVDKGVEGMYSIASMVE